MALKDRATLKNLFRKGSLPTENSFADIIDSSINKIDDGFSKSMDDGLMLSPIGKSKKVLSVYNKITDKKAEWSIESDDEAGLQKDEKHLNFRSNSDDSTLLTLVDKKRVGVNNDTPQFELDVNGYAASSSRVGTRASDSLTPADGKWHTIIDDLNYCNMFEIVARTGILKSGKHAMVHGIAMGAYGNSYSRIKLTHARFSFWRPLKIQLRWVGDTYNYKLQMRSSRNLGKDAMIKYYVTELWSDSKIGHSEHFQKPSEV